MVKYLIRRVLASLLTLLILSVAVFALVRAIPGSALDLALEGNFNFSDRQALEKELGLDKPVVVQYLSWIGGVVRGDLGKSLTSRRPVIDDIKLRFPRTLEIAFLSIIFIAMLAIPIGVISAVKQYTTIDYVLRGISIGLISIPYFWVATLAVIFPARWWGWSPPLGVVKITEDPIGNLIQFGIPALLLALFTAGGTLMRVTRAQMLEVLRTDYLRTARAKGLGGNAIVIRHALRNALIPVITLLGLTLSNLIAGTVILEQIFRIPGLGSYVLSSVTQRDYVAIQSIVFLFGVMVTTVNLLTDLAYGLVDPRIKYS